MTKAVAEALRSARAGQDIDVEHLSPNELWDLVDDMDWQHKHSLADLIPWCGGPPPLLSLDLEPDYERLILDRQEADESWWG